MEISKRFTNSEMTWVKVLLLAVATAVLTAVLKLITPLDGTSFQDIAINLECWMLFAVFIIVNCKKWYEAVLKTFVFFLVSQPLIYLIQVPFDEEGFGLFRYYEYWFKITLLTLPGAAIAYQIKRRDILGAAVLSVGIAFLGYMAAEYFWDVKAVFPRHLLSMCFCILLAVFFILTLIDRKVLRIAAAGVLTVSLTVSLILVKPIFTQTLLPAGGSWTVTAEDPSVADILTGEDASVTVKAKKDGTTFVTAVNEEGETREFLITVSGGGVFINEMEQ